MLATLGFIFLLAMFACLCDIFSNVSHEKMLKYRQRGWWT